MSKFDKRNASRGARWRKAARDLFHECTPPAIVNSERLDAFFANLDDEYDPTTLGPHSRWKWVGRINSGSVHALMNTGDCFAYSIRSIGKDQWLLEPVQDTVMEGQIVRSLRQAIAWGKRIRTHYEQSLPFDRLPEFESKQVHHALEQTRVVLETCEQLAVMQVAHQQELIHTIRTGLRQLAPPEEEEE